MSLEYIKKLREMIQILQLADKWVTFRYGDSPHVVRTVEQLLDSFYQRVGRTSLLLLVVQHLVRDLKAEALTINWTQGYYNKDLADSPFVREVQNIICEEAAKMGCSSI